jgi:hypothetical protein
MDRFGIEEFTLSDSPPNRPRWICGEVVKLLALAYKDVVFDLYEGPNDSYCIDAASEYDDDAVRLFLSVDHLDCSDVSLSGKVIWESLPLGDHADPGKWLFDAIAPYLDHGLSLVRLRPRLGFLSPTKLESSEKLAEGSARIIKAWKGWTHKAS